MEVPKPLVPQVEACLVSLHLVFDDPQVHVSSLSCYRLQSGEVAIHAIQDSPLELEEIDIDAQPVACIFPMRGVEVFTFQRTGRSSLHPIG